MPGGKEERVRVRVRVRVGVGVGVRRGENVKILSF